MKKVVVVGGGPAGMLAADMAASRGHQVTLIEKNNKLGKKLYITGKGRCNLTNDGDVETLIQNTVGNPYFMYSGYYTFDSAATRDYFAALGVETKVERGNRVYPVSEKASDIVRALERTLQKRNVRVLLNTPVRDITLMPEGNFLVTAHEKIQADGVILATGGLSYPMTGSTGDGFTMAKKLGHTITALYPSLVPLKAKESWVSQLQGLSLKNIAIAVSVAGKVVYKDFGEMMFTHFGVTGPVILSASRFVAGQLGKEVVITIDLKPALSEKELDQRLLKDFQRYVNKDFKNALDELLPQKCIPVMIELSGISPTKKVNEITKEERKALVFLLKNLRIGISDTTGYNEAVVTAGGICVNEIDPSTMESKCIPGLFFAGEMIDVDCFTGGFNLQVAFSTAYLAGTNI